MDINLKIVRVNAWIEKMYSKEGKFTGRKCYEVYQKRDTPCPWCPSLKTIETGETHNAIVPYPSEENPTGWIELSSFSLRNIEGDKDATPVQIVYKLKHKKTKGPASMQPAHEFLKNCDLGKGMYDG